MKLTTILGYVLFLNFFFFHNLGSTSSGIIFIGRFIFLTLIFKSIKDIKKDPFSVFGIFVILTSFVVGLVIRANLFVQTTLGLASATLLYVYAYSMSSGIPMVRSLSEFVLAPVYFLGTYIKSVFRTIKIIFTADFKQLGLEKAQSNKNFFIQSMIIGFGIGLFVVAILISMFSNADPIFATYVKKIVSADFLQSLFLRVLLSLLFGFLLLPYVILKRKNIFNSPLGLLKRLNFINEMSVVMVLVSLVIGLFLVVQWPYVFAQVPFETDLSKFGVATYSEYVRKGFVELLKIAFFVYGLIWTGLIVLRENNRQKNVLRLIQIIVLSEFFIFLFSILRRIWLYQTYHGWSLIRVYGSFFLFWIFGISVFLALRHFWQKRYVIGELIFTSIIIFSIGILNVETFIINTHPPTVNKKVDYIYLSRLSADGYEGWEKAFNQAKKTITKYEFKNGELNREERKEIAYAGIIIRELSKNYKDLIKKHGTNEVKKQYLLSIFTYQREANYKQQYSSNSSYVTNMSGYLEKMKDKVAKGKVEYNGVFDSINISNSEDRFKFNTGSLYMNQSFYEFPYYSDYFVDRLQKNVENKDGFLDRLYVWNFTNLEVYKKIIKNERHSELLQLQGKYFNLYMKIISQPTNEREFDMDVSLASPLLD